MTTTRKPQDHLPSKSEQLAAEVETPEGAELLVPAAKLPSWDRLDLIALLQETFKALGVDLDDTGASFDVDSSDPTVLRALAHMQRGLLIAAQDQNRFVEFASSPGSIEAVTNLAMWYLVSLGESMGSAA